METIIIGSGILALGAYVPLWKQIRSGTAKQNLLTWILWGMLDAIASGTIIVQSGNFVLAAAFAIGSLLTAVVIAHSDRKFLWTWFETMVTLLVTTCLLVWYVSGSRVATIASTTALFVAGIPQLKDAWRRPEEVPTLPYAVWAVADILSLAGGKTWSIEERLYPLSALIICFAIAAVSLRKLPIRTTAEPSSL